MGQAEKFVGSVYDLVSGGIRVKQVILEALIGDRSVDDYVRENVSTGRHSNLVSSSDTYNREVAGGTSTDFKTRADALFDLQDELEQVVIRSAINGQITDDDSDIGMDEWRSLISRWYRGEIASEQTLQDLYGLRSRGVSLIAGLRRANLEEVRIDEFSENMRECWLSDELRPRVVELYAQTLEFMADIVETLAPRYGLILDFVPLQDEDFTRSWKETFQQDVPTMKHLVDISRGLVSRARQRYERS